MNSAVIVGGTGLIGIFFARFLLDGGHVDIVHLIDIEHLEVKSSQFLKKYAEENSGINYIQGDVRQSIDKLDLLGHVRLVANFAAIHREPGHKDFEYFETNILGAENICEFAESVSCKSIIFTSSISPYGISESIKD